MIEQTSRRWWREERERNEGKLDRVRVWIAVGAIDAMEMQRKL